MIIKDDIIFLIYYDHMSGEFTSILDAYSYISQTISCSLVVVAERNKELLRLRKSLPRQHKIYLRNEFELSLKAKKIICSSFYFSQLSKGKIQNFISADHVILLDSTSFVLSKYQNHNILETINNFDSIVYILGNSFNSQFFKKNYFHYLHKIDFSRVLEAAGSYTASINLKFDKSNNAVADPLLHKALVYSRNVKLTYSPPYFYFENIGKLIFEFAYLGKPVYYSNKNKTMDDGLTEYLQLFDIDDSVDNQLINIDNNTLVKKLSFNSNDLLLKLCKD